MDPEASKMVRPAKNAEKYRRFAEEHRAKAHQAAQEWQQKQMTWWRRLVRDYVRPVVAFVWELGGLQEVMPGVQRWVDRASQVPDVHQPAFIDNVCDLMKNQQICTMFSAVDADGSGEISHEELEQVVSYSTLPLHHRQQHSSTAATAVTATTTAAPTPPPPLSMPPPRR